MHSHPTMLQSVRHIRGEHSRVEERFLLDVHTKMLKNEVAIYTQGHGLYSNFNSFILEPSSNNNNISGN